MDEYTTPSEKPISIKTQVETIKAQSSLCIQYPQTQNGVTGLVFCIHGDFKYDHRPTHMLMTGVVYTYLSGETTISANMFKKEDNVENIDQMKDREFKTSYQVIHYDEKLAMFSYCIDGKIFVKFINDSFEKVYLKYEKFA